jgi:hypothetical protein
MSALVLRVLRRLHLALAPFLMQDYARHTPECYAISACTLQPPELCDVLLSPHSRWDVCSWPILLKKCDDNLK